MSKFLGGFLGTNPTTQTSTSNSSGTSNSSNSSGGWNSNLSTVTPNNPEWFKQFQQKQAGNLNQLWDLSQKDVIGHGEKANYLQNLNSSFNGAGDNLGQMLASRGALNSGAYQSGLQGLELGRLGNYTSFLNSIPGLNQQAKLQGGGQVASLMNSFNPNFGQTNSGMTKFDQWGSQNGSTTGSQTGSQTTQQDGGLLGGLGKLFGGAASSFLGGGLGNLTKGLSFFG